MKILCCSLISDASGNPVTQSVVGVTDSSGNSVTGKDIIDFFVLCSANWTHCMSIFFIL